MIRTIGKDLEALQEAHALVKTKWAFTPSGSEAEKEAKGILERLEQKLDVLAIIITNRAREVQ